MHVDHEVADEFAVFADDSYVATARDGEGQLAPLHVGLTALFRGISQIAFAFAVRNIDD